MAARSLVLIVSLRHRHHIARISAPMSVGCRPVPAESGVGVASAEPVELAPFDLGRRCLVWHADGAEIKVRLAPFGEGVHILEAVLCPGTEPARDSVGLG